MLHPWILDVFHKKVFWPSMETFLGISCFQHKNFLVTFLEKFSFGTKYLCVCAGKRFVKISQIPSFMKKNMTHKIWLMRDEQT